MLDIPLVVNDASLSAQGADVVAGTLDLCEIGLVKDDIDITADTPYTALEAAKADYTGYAVKVVTWSAVTRSDDGHIEFLGTIPAPFRPTGTTTGNSIRGLYVRNGAHNEVLMACKFPDGPYPMESALDAIALTLRYRPDGGNLVAVLS